MCAASCTVVTWCAMCYAAQMVCITMLKIGGPCNCDARAGSPATKRVFVALNLKFIIDML